MVVKPGYKTSEFWAAVLASAATWIAQWAGTLDPRYAAIVTAVAAGAYAFSRAITKHGVATGNARLVPAQSSEPVPVQIPVLPTPPPAL